MLQDCTSDKLTLHRVASQGRILGPLLNILYIRDKAIGIDNVSEFTQYAHNAISKLWTYDTSIVKNQVKLEQNTNILIEIFHEIYLTVNTTKSEFLIFDKRKIKDFNEKNLWLQLKWMRNRIKTLTG